MSVTKFYVVRIRFIFQSSALTYLHPCVLIFCCLAAIPTPEFVATVVLLEVDADFLADPLRSPPCPLLVVVALGVQDVVWRSVGEAVLSGT